MSKRFNKIDRFENEKKITAKFDTKKNLLQKLAYKKLQKLQKIQKNNFRKMSVSKSHSNEAHSQCCL